MFRGGRTGIRSARIVRYRWPIAAAGTSLPGRHWKAQSQRGSFGTVAGFVIGEFLVRQPPDIEHHDTASGVAARPAAPEPTVIRVGACS